MKRIGLILVLGLVLSPSHAGTAAPTSTEIRQRYLAFRGGEQVLRGLKVVERKGTMTVYAQDGSRSSGEYHTCVRYPDQVMERLDVGQIQVARYLNPDGAFSCRGAFKDCSPADQETAEGLKADAKVANREMLYSTDDWSSGQVTDQGGGLYRVTFPDAYYVFDSATGELHEQGKGGRSRIYRDWRVIGGMRIPFVIEDYAGGEPRYFAKLDTVTNGDSLSPWCAAHLR